jgi:hypothetical protein
MKTRILIVIIAICAACSTNPKPAQPAPPMNVIQKVFYNPDGTFSTRKLLLYIDYGLQAGCIGVTGTSTTQGKVCTYGNEALDAAVAVNTKDQLLLVTSVSRILQTAVHDHPELQPQFEWALQVLDVVRQVLEGAAK